MQSISEVRRENLLKVLEAKKIKKAELAKMSGRSAQQVSQFTLGTRAIGEKLARELEKLLGLSAFFLDVDKNVEEVESATHTKRIPILSWVQAGNPHACGDLEYNDCLVVDESIPDGCYVLVVNGDSMIPEFHDGDQIIVDPNKYPKPGSFVIGRMNSDGNCESTLKQYAVVGIDQYGRDIFELRPLNPLYPTFKSNEMQIEVIAVVIENRKKYS